MVSMPKLLLMTHRRMALAVLISCWALVVPAVSFSPSKMLLQRRHKHACPIQPWPTTSVQQQRGCLQQSTSCTARFQTSLDDHNDTNQNNNNNNNNDEYTLHVSYEGRTCQTTIRPGESILAALERTGTADALAMPSLPSDCRRGNCLTCVGKHTTLSSTNNLQAGENGLSPHMSRQARRRGYILTCSSFVKGDGVQLELGVNQQAWDELYRQGFQDEATQLIGRAAVAKVMRFHAEHNPDEWVRETEELLRKSSSSSSSSSLE